ncbi:MAG: hypothetical protein ACYC7L_03765 [Nitrospirota bacterium]
MARDPDDDIKNNRRDAINSASTLLNKSSDELLADIFYYSKDKTELNTPEERTKMVLACQSALYAKLSKETEKTSDRMLWLNIVLAIIALSVFFDFPKITIFGGDGKTICNKHTANDPHAKQPKLATTPVANK